MTDLGAFLLAVGIFLCGCAIDNGLSNIAQAILRGGRKWE